MRLIDADGIMMHGFQPPEFSVCPVDICHDNVAVDAYKRGWNDAIEAIVQNEPTVEPKTGKWMKEWRSANGYTRINGYKCSGCTVVYPLSTNFCPNCGARMEDEHMANLREYAHDFGVTIEQAEEALRREE